MTTDSIMAELLDGVFSPLRIKPIHGGYIAPVVLCLLCNNPERFIQHQKTESGEEKDWYRCDKCNTLHSIVVKGGRRHEHRAASRATEVSGEDESDIRETIE